MLVRLADGRANLVVYDQCRLKGLVGQHDVGGHACCSGKSHHKWSDNLVKALVDIDAGSCDLATCCLFELDVKLGEPPALFGSCTWDTSKHGWICPCADPVTEVLHPDRSPQPVEG